MNHTVVNALHPIGKYLGFVRQGWIERTTFRLNFAAWLVFPPLHIFVLYLVWRAIFAYISSLGGLGFDQVLFYYLGVYFIARIIHPVLTVNYIVWEDINRGRIDVFLSRPVSYLLALFSTRSSYVFQELVVSTLYFTGCVLIIQIPRPGALNIIFFLVALANGFLVAFLIQFLIGTMTFWTGKIFGLRDIVVTVSMLLSGQLVPVMLLPEPIGLLSKVMPFQSVFAVPLSVLLWRGPFDLAFFVGTYLIQGLWIVSLATISRILWLRGLRRYMSFGG